MANSRYPRVNPKSGLQEEWDDHFQVPSVKQRSISSLRFNGQSTAVHTVPLANGLTLDFYARLGAADELAVTFHGAYRKDKYLYPRFERVQSLEKLFPAHIAFADPTLRMDRSKSMLLSWYLGGPRALQHARSVQAAPDGQLRLLRAEHPRSPLLDTHFEPFRAALGATPTGEEEPRGKRWLALYEGQKEGHGAMTPPEFREHLARALTWWRARRPAAR